MIIMAMLGIFLSIVAPSLNRAKDAARSAGRPPVASSHEPSARTPEGNLSPIEVSEYSQNSEPARPEQYVGRLFGGLAFWLPLLFFIFAVWMIYSQFRRRAKGRAE
jgi:hypothetical protein